jgi:hypothetical protein
VRELDDARVCERFPQAGGVDHIEIPTSCRVRT